MESWSWSWSWTWTLVVTAASLCVWRLCGVGCRAATVVLVVSAALSVGSCPSLCVAVVPVVVLLWAGLGTAPLPGRGRSVLITGCDSGFGLALARRLSEAQVTVFAGVLDLNGDGARILRDLENLQVLQLDVTDAAQVEAAHRYVSDRVGETGLWGLVNNAGVLHCPADAELLPLATCRRCMDVNFLGAVHMSQVFLPLLRRRGGRLVNVSSLGGVIPIPMFAAYGASKAALTIFSSVMRLEAEPWGVSVALIQAGGFRTNIFGSDDDISRHRDELLAAASPQAREDYGTAYISSLPDSIPKMRQQMSEDVSPVVDAMCDALLSRRPRPVYEPGPMAQLLPFLHRHCPTAMFDRIITRLPRFNEHQPAGLRR